MKQLLFLCLLMSFNLMAQSDTEDNTATALYGGVANFDDLQSLVTDNKKRRIRHKRKKGLDRIRVKGNQEVIREYYAYFHAGVPYINAKSYGGTSFFFTRVLESGRYLYMEDIFTSEKREVRIHGSQSGAYPSNRTNGTPQQIFIAPEVKKYKIGVIIDTHTGTSNIINDDVLNELLYKYPQFRQRYQFDKVLTNSVQLPRVRNLIKLINESVED